MFIHHHMLRNIYCIRKVRRKQCCYKDLLPFWIIFWDYFVLLWMKHARTNHDVSPVENLMEVYDICVHDHYIW